MTKPQGTSLYLGNASSNLGAHALMVGISVGGFLERREASLLVSAVYLAAGSLWILFFDRFLAAAVGGPAASQYVAVYYGEFSLLVVTAVVLYFMTREHLLNVRRSQRELRESEERFRTAFLQAPVGIVITDLEGRWLRVNEAFCRMVGHAEGELLERGPRLVAHPDDTAASDRLFDDLRSGKAQSINPEARYLHRDGHTVWAEVTASVLKDREGKPLNFVLQAHDIGDRKSGEEALLRSEELLRTVISGAPVVLFSVDKNGVFTLLEGRDLGILGLAPGEVVGKSVFDAGSHFPKIEEDIHLAMAGEAHTSTVNLGQSVYEIRYTPRFDEEGQIEGAIGMASDITSRWRAERELEENAARLEEKVRERTVELENTSALLLQAQWLAAVGEVTSKVAHDLRNPLTAINTSLYYLEQTLPGGLEPKAQASVGSIREAVFHANSILEDLLEYSKPSETKKVPIDLGRVIRRAAQVGVPDGVRISLGLAPEVRIEGSEEKLVLVFRNLIENAVEAMPEGGELGISSRTERDRVVVELTDTGVGIPEDKKGKLFTPFFTTKAQGLGMGLALCRRLVEAHGGTIEIASEQGKGTTVVITFPLLTAFEAERRAR